VGDYKGESWVKADLDETNRREDSEGQYPEKEEVS
jgi:hypothetical protein